MAGSFSNNTPYLYVIITARNEAERIGITLNALRDTFPRARLIVADDASEDGTADLATAMGAELVGQERRRGKGGAATAAASLLEDTAAKDSLVVFCDGDLGASASELSHLVDVIERDGADLAVASVRQRRGGGFGLAVGFARWALRWQTGLSLKAPISGQRAMRASTLAHVLPFAYGFGMEVGMTADAVRAGLRLREVELDLHHRNTGRDLRGFLHRGAQLRDFLRALATGRRRRTQKKPVADTPPADGGQPPDSGA